MKVSQNTITMLVVKPHRDDFKVEMYTWQLYIIRSGARPDWTVLIPAKISMGELNYRAGITRTRSA